MESIPAEPLFMTNITLPDFLGIGLERNVTRTNVGHERT